jgi:hypothetical protein
MKSYELSVTTVPGELNRSCAPIENAVFHLANLYILHENTILQDPDMAEDVQVVAEVLDKIINTMKQLTNKFKKIKLLPTKTSFYNSIQTCVECKR